MALTQLTEREKLVLSFAAYTDCNDWHYIYHMSLERPRKEISKKTSAASRWKHSPKVVTYFKDQQAAAAARIVEAKREAIRAFVDSLPENLQRAIKEQRDIDPEEFALPPRLQKIRPGMTRDEFESAERINPRTASKNEMEFARANGIDPSGTAATYVPDVGPADRNRENGKDQRERERERESITPDGTRIGVPPHMIDFRNREELLNYYNRKANEVTDEKLRFDIAKFVAEQEKMKADAAGKGKITLAWLPLRCYECPLYVAQRDRVDAANEGG